jgi:hypothetical protein
MWESKKKTPMMEITHKNTRKGDMVLTHEIISEQDMKYYMDNSLNDTDKELKLFVLETLENKISDGPGHNSTLIAGIRDGKEMYFMGIMWKKEGTPGIRQYFFRNDKPSSFNYGHVSGPGWPLNINPFIVEDAKEYFDELKVYRPKISESLDRCIELLSKPGPEYKKGDTGITMKLR